MTALLLLSFAFACQNTEERPRAVNSRLDLIPEPDKALRLEYEKNQQFLQMSDDSLWQYLAFEKGGCLTGGQYGRNGAFGGETCVMRRAKEWEIFFGREEEKLTHLLLSKIADTTTTHVHTCPYFNATEGELAVYALQFLYEVNWFNIEPFQSYRDKDIEEADDNMQAWLQQILADEEQRNVLLGFWQRKMQE